MIPENDSKVESGNENSMVVKMAPYNPNQDRTHVDRTPGLPLRPVCIHDQHPELPVGKVTGFTPSEEVKPIEIKSQSIASDEARAVMQAAMLDRTLKAFAEKAGVLEGVTPTTTKPSTITAAEILANMRKFEDEQMDQDVALFQAFRRMGAMIMIADPVFYPSPVGDGPIVVTLPPRWKRVERELEKREMLRRQAVDQIYRLVPPSIYVGHNLCNGIPMP